MMVNRVTFLFHLLLIPFIIAACDNAENGNDPDPTPKVTLSVEPASLHFSAEGGEKSISITSNSAWTIAFDADTWARPSISVSKGDAEVTITADASEVEEERSLVLTISAGTNDDKKEIEVTVIQDAFVPPDGQDDYIDPDATGMRDLSSVEFAQLMTVGWNLGNSLEAIQVNNGVLSGDETSWGNPVVTRRLIDSVAMAGFNTIRIPVSWSHKIVDESTFEISSSWLERVEEVVNYALDNELFVIINIHWDGGWMDHPYYDRQDDINTKLRALWKQIAVHFRDYDDQLLFAGTNEVHVEGDYSDPSPENVEVQNSFNQTFVDAVRSTGGRNTYRFLVVQAYNTNIGYAIEHMVMPDDDTENRLLTEVHFYDPYDFTLQTDGDFKTQWGEAYAGGDVSSWGQEAWVDEAFGMMKTHFVDKGVGVILGEYGAVLRSDLTGEELEKHIAARNYYLEYVTHAAIANGLVPIYWDNGWAGNNGFALFNRQTGEVVDDQALQAILKGATQ